jgi:hypothetical protein
MATYANGVNGTFKGKVGSVIGSTWRGTDYIKGLYNIPKNSTPSDAQQRQRDKMNITGNFMKSMKLVVKLGFDSDTGNKSAYNSATAYVMKNALDTTTTPYSIRYNLLLMTRGEYPGVYNPTVMAGASGKIQFNWTDTTGVGVAKANDKAVLIAYSPADNRIIFRSKGTGRSAGTAILSVSPFKGQTVETYIAFLKADGTEVSSSIYTGQVIVLA